MKKEEHVFTIATYNIQITANPELIVQNIAQMRDDGVTVICLQEVRDVDGKAFIQSVEKTLGKEWQSEYFLDRFGLAVFWDTRVLSLKEAKKVFLPQVTKRTIAEKTVDWIIRNKGEAIKRKVLICTFSVFGKTFRLSNIHLDWQQGPEQRSLQLRTLLDSLHAAGQVDAECLCGDFNTIHVLKENHEQFSLDKLFASEYKDVTRAIPWTLDWHNSNYVAPVSFLMRKLKIHYYQKLDYIWVKNMDATSVKTLPMQGSDHLPVVATLKLK
jgi:endonuclease/exonuclease/phosphatase family metal-dependent hydrolase